jgi:hypothetical protein
MQNRPSCQFLSRTVIVGLLMLSGGCGGFINDALLNTVVGGVVPKTPGPVAPFILVRASNRTAQNIDFIVTAEIERLVRDNEGNFVVDDDGNFVTTPERRTVRLSTFPGGNSSEVGVLFDCSLEPITFIGLGENLLPTDAAVFVGGAGPGGAGGFGVTADRVNPLSLAAGNYDCGDTIIFEAFQALGVPGGVALQAFLLPGSEQPGSFSGPSTFVNLANFLASQRVSEE